MFSFIFFGHLNMADFHFQFNGFVPFSINQLSQHPEPGLGMGGGGGVDDPGSCCQNVVTTS